MCRTENVFFSKMANLLFVLFSVLSALYNKKKISIQFVAIVSAVNSAKSWTCCAFVLHGWLSSSVFFIKRRIKVYQRYVESRETEDSCYSMERIIADYKGAFIKRDDCIIQFCFICKFEKLWSINEFRLIEVKTVQNCNFYKFIKCWFKCFFKTSWNN